MADNKRAPRRAAQAREPALPPVEQVVVTDARLDDARLILDGIDVDRGPQFTVSEVAKFFFGRSPHWVRWLEGEGKFLLDGVFVGGIRTKQGMRTYNLAHIERMAHALASHGAITGTQLRNTLLLVETSARVWGYL